MNTATNEFPAAPKGKAAAAKVKKVMGEYKEGSLKSGGKTPVKNRKQAIAIALSEARKES